MTEFEISELRLHRLDIAAEFAGLYFTLVSAYLVVSYLVGDKLSAPQLIIISTLYVLWVVGLIHGMYNNTLEAIRLNVELERLNPNTRGHSLQSSRVAGFGFFLVQIGGLLASLYFMWSLRP